MNVKNERETKFVNGRSRKKPKKFIHSPNHNLRLEEEIKKDPRKNFVMYRPRKKIPSAS